jgi:hypothetical protein
MVFKPPICTEAVKPEVPRIGAILNTMATAGDWPPEHRHEPHLGCTQRRWRSWWRKAGNFSRGPAPHRKT